MLDVTCAALALVLANPASSGAYRLVEDCGPRTTLWSVRPALEVPVVFARPVEVDATGRQVSGLVVRNGGNLIWRGGRIVSPGGQPNLDTAGPSYYGVLVEGGRNVMIDGVHLTSARKAMVVRRGSKAVTLTRSRCDGDVEDCMVVASSEHIRFTDNDMGPTTRLPPTCRKGAEIREAVRKSVCEAEGGVWRDGWHSDVLQLFNGAKDVVASGNRIHTLGHGLAQMDSPGHAPLERVVFENNVIASGRHGLTLGACSDCRITGNRLTSAVPGMRSVIRPGEALACDNVVPDGGKGRDPCR